MQQMESEPTSLNLNLVRTPEASKLTLFHAIDTPVWRRMFCLVRREDILRTRRSAPQEINFATAAEKEDIFG